MDKVELMNLLENAVDAVKEQARKEEAKTLSPPFKPVINVQSKAVDGFIEISISDNGPGIPDTIRNQIFDPFFTTKPTGSGTGLGLSLSYEIITQGHNGAISLQDTDQGTTFVVRLPEAKQEDF